MRRRRLAAVLVAAAAVVCGALYLLHGDPTTRAPPRRSEARGTDRERDPGPNVGVHGSAVPGSAAERGFSVPDRSLLVRIAERSRCSRPVRLHVFRISTLAGQSDGEWLMSRDVEMDEREFSIQLPVAQDGDQLWFVLVPESSYFPVCARRVQLPHAGAVSLTIQPTTTLAIQLDGDPATTGTPTRLSGYFSSAGDSTPHTRYQGEVPVDVDRLGGQCTIEGLPRSLFTVRLVRQVGRQPELYRIDLDEETETLTVPAPRSESLTVVLPAGVPAKRYTVMVSSTPQNRLMDNMRRAHSDDPMGEFRSQVAGANQTITFDSLTGERYAVSVLEEIDGNGTDISYRTVWRETNIRPVGQTLNTDIHRNPWKGGKAPMIHLLAPSSGFPPEWSGTVRYEIFVDHLTLEGRIRAHASIRLPEVHGVARLEFIPDSQTAHSLAVSSTIVDLESAGPRVSLQLWESRSIALPERAAEARFFVFEQPPGIPAVQLSRDEFQGLIEDRTTEGRRLWGVPIRNGVYCVSEEREILAVEGASLAPLELVNATDLNRFIHVISWRTVGAERIPVRVDAHSNAKVTLPPGEYELREAVPTYAGEKVTWKSFERFASVVVATGTTASVALP